MSALSNDPRRICETLRHQLETKRASLLEGVVEYATHARASSHDFGTVYAPLVADLAATETRIHELEFFSKLLSVSLPAVEQLLKAARVILETEATVMWLETHDRTALAQLEKATRAAESYFPSSREGK